MTNESKFVTVTERIEAFRKYCEKMHDRPGGSCGKQERCSVCSLKWLDLEYEDEKPLPCPFCGSECKLDDLNRVVNCTKCDYMSGGDIAAHNRVAKKCGEEVK